MKHKLTILALFLGSAAFADDVKAAAHCFADVAISVDGQQSANANKIWDRRTNGKKWFQIQGNHRSECDSLAANYFNSIDLEQWAIKNNQCGKISATGSSWIGTSSKRGELGPKTIEIDCNVAETGSDGEVLKDYQYSTKLVCGNTEKQNWVISGQYRGVVNIHNPSYKNVDFRYKFARAEAGKDGAISDFKDSKIGPDGAQYFGCDQVSKLLGMPQPFDGFFVIESREPLDVVAYYTSGKGDEMTIDVETTKERETANNKQWSCGNINADLANVDGWRLGNVPATVAQTFNYKGLTPINETPVYEQDGMDLWLSNQEEINTSQQAGNYNYDLDFCLCEGNGYPASANINILALRADNRVQANIDGPANTFISGTNDHSGVAGSGTVLVNTGGSHFLSLAAVNDTRSYHAVGLSGTINIKNGYLGRCPVNNTAN